MIVEMGDSEEFLYDAIRKRKNADPDTPDGVVALDEAKFLKQLERKESKWRAFKKQLSEEDAKRFTKMAKALAKRAGFDADILEVQIAESIANPKVFDELGELHERVFGPPIDDPFGKIQSSRQPSNLIDDFPWPNFCRELAELNPRTRVQGVLARVSEAFHHKRGNLGREDESVLDCWNRMVHYYDRAGNVPQQLSSELIRINRYINKGTSQAAKFERLRQEVPQMFEALEEAREVDSALEALSRPLISEPPRVRWVMDRVPHHRALIGGHLKRARNRELSWRPKWEIVDLDRIGALERELSRRGGQDAFSPLRHDWEHARTMGSERYVRIQKRRLSREEDRSPATVEQARTIRDIQHESLMPHALGMSLSQSRVCLHHGRAYADFKIAEYRLTWNDTYDSPQALHEKVRHKGLRERT